LRYLGVTPNDNAKAMAVSRNDDPADKVLAAYRQLPAQATADPAPSVASTDGIAVPDTTGMGARDAIRAMLGAGLVPQLEGSGHSVKQSPAAGTLVPKGSSVRVSFEQSS
jgi:cell division protein FtsI (penicillin-binding protein 3)